MASTPSRCAEITIDRGLFPYARSGSDPGSWQGTVLVDKPDATGTYYRRNRSYDPNTARFTQEDPIGLAGGLNLYGFANGDPVSYSDPLGLDPSASSSAWTERADQAIADGGAQRGGKPGTAAVNLGAALDVGFEATGINGAASTGDAIANGRTGEALLGVALLAVPGGAESGAVRTEARTLTEQLTLEEARAAAGAEIMQNQINDATRAGRWSIMQHVHANPDGTNIVIHYWKDMKTGVMELFKFKNP